MKTKALRRVTLAAMATILLVVGAAQPARADDGDGGDPDWIQYVELGVDLWKSINEKAAGGFDPVEIAQLILELKDALNGVKTDLFEHVDALALADIRTGAKFAVDNVRMLDLPQTQGYYVGQVAFAAANSYEKLTTFSSDAARDTVARVMITEYSALIPGEIKVGYAPSYGPYRQALDHIIANVKPDCTETFEPKVGTTSYTCSFDGDTIVGKQRPGSNGELEHSYGGTLWFEGPLDFGVVEDVIMEGTARDLAKRALAELTLGGH